MERNWRILFVIFLTLICRQFVDAFYTNQRRFGSEERTRRHIINKNEVPVNVEWLTDEQLSELGTLDSTHQVVEKIRSFYQSLVSSEEKKAAANKIVHQCYDWLPEVTNEAERDELKRLHHTDHAACKDRIGVYISRLSTARQDQLRHYWDFCEHVWHDTVQHQDVVAMEAAAAAEQAEENDGEITAGDGNQSEVISSRRRRSYDSNREVLDDEEDDDDGDEGSVEQDVDQLAQNYYNIEWTTSSHRKQPKRKHKNYNSVELMDIIYGNSNGDEPHIRQHRNRRHNHDHHDHDADHMEHTLEECFNAHLSWLNDAQKKALAELKGAGVERAAILDKVFEFYEETTDMKKENATALLRSGCRDMLRNALGDQGAAEVRKMKESGRTPLEIAAKIREMVGALSDEKKKTAANDYVPYCAKLYGVKLNSGGGKLARRRRRHDGHQHQTLDDYFKTHLSWLNDVQKEELRTLKASAQSRADLQKKVYDFYETTTGEVKEKATELLKSGCQELLHGLIGEDKANEVKKLKEAGKTVDEIAVKVKEMVAAVTDSAKMELAKEYGPYCQKLYGVKSGGRKRRDHHHGNHLDHHGQHTLEDYYKTHLSWLTDVQKEELKSLKASGQSRADLQKQIYKYYDTTTGDTKDKATELLNSGCQELLKTVIGEDKANEIKKLKDTGKTVNEIATKVREWVDAIPDEHKKSIAKDYLPQCAKLYGVKSRKRRDHHHGNHLDHHGQHTLEDYYKTHLSWLTDVQKEELKSLKASGQSRADLQKQIYKYYDTTTGDTKDKATELLKSGCQELLKTVIGEDKANEIKKLKDTGKTVNEIATKVREWVDAIPDEHKKSIAKDYLPQCAKLYGVKSRKRRDHHHGNHLDHHGQHTLEDYYKTHLSWLTDVQKEELKSLKASGQSRADLQKQIYKYYDTTTGDTKDKATELLKSGCQELLKTVIGEDKANEIKKLKDTGKTVNEIATKVREWVDAIPDEHKKAIAKDYLPQCAKLYGVKSRKRRDHHHGNHLDHHGQHTLEDYYKTHLSWLTDVQKEELKSLKASGQSRADLQKQIYKYYDTTTGDTKDKATELLKSGCQELLKTVIGEDKANEIKKLKDTEKTVNEIATKVREWVDAIPDEHKKSIAKDYLPQCAKLYGVKSRKRRDHQLEDYFSSHLSWLTDAQKEDLKSFKASGQSRSDLHEKIRDYFEATTGETKEKATTQMKAGCQELLTQLIGEEKMAEVKRLKEAGTPLSDIAVKVDEFISALTDDAAKARVKEYGPHCQKLFNLSDEKTTKRRRRHHENGGHHHHHHEHTLEDYMATHLEWLTDEQKAEIRARKAAGESRLALQHAVFEFYYALPSDGEIKMAAMTQLKTVCRESLARVAQKVSNSTNQLKFDGDDAAIPAQIDALTFTLSHLSETESGRSSAMEADSVREVGPHCRRLFIGNDAVAHVSHRLRRNHHSLLTRRTGRKEVAEEMLTKTADQEENAKRLLREMTASPNAPVDADIMLAGCEQLTKRFFGRQNAHRLTLLYRSGELEILKRNVASLVELISDAKRQAETRRYMNVCWTVVSTLNGGLEEN